MMENEENKRLFFALEIQAPWPRELPLGRVLEPNQRHMTLAFLGNVAYKPLLQALARFPISSMPVGLTGHFEECLFLPVRHPNVVAWHASWHGDASFLYQFQNSLSEWLRQLGYKITERKWLPHLTLCRKPFDPHAWKKNFHPLPFYTGAVHLYESLGNLVYQPIWSYPVQHPFEELEHTADIAFAVYGETYRQLYDNAFTGLAFKFPSLLGFYGASSDFHSIDDVVMALNEVIARADIEKGCPFKAVSFHGEVISIDKGLLRWEMIVDV